MAIVKKRKNAECRGMQGTAHMYLCEIYKSLRISLIGGRLTYRESPGRLPPEPAFPLETAQEIKEAGEIARIAALRRRI